MNNTVYSMNGNRSAEDRMNSIVKTYQNRYPTLFDITMKEAKDDVRFVFSVSR